MPRAERDGERFPEAIPCPVGPGVMKPRIFLPHVWVEPKGQPFAIYWSEEAGIGRLVPTPTPEELSRWYATESYERYMGVGPDGSPVEGEGQKAETKPEPKPRPAPGRPPLRNRLLFRLARALDHGEDVSAAEIHGLLRGRPGKICDVGCGSGELLGDLRALGHDVLGIEPSADGRTATAARGVKVLDGTAESLPEGCPTEAFDVVVMIQSLEHCLDPIRAIENVNRLLKPGGTFVCEVPNAGCIGFQLSSAAWFHADAGRHLTYFTRKGLCLALEQAGLHVDAVRFAGYTRQFAWLSAEQEVWDSLFADGDAEKAEGRDFRPPPRPNERRQWMLATRAAVSAPERRYDSIRIHARRPARS
jgi:SAM-dependent methyltransferase